MRLSPFPFRILFPAITLVVLLLSCDAPPVSEIDLDGDWITMADAEDRGMQEQWFQPGFERKNWETIRLDRTGWSAGGADLIRWYGYRFTADLTDSLEILRIHWIAGDVRVWLNGAEVGWSIRHGSMYARDVSGILRNGVNELIVRCKALEGRLGLRGRVSLVRKSHWEEHLRSPYGRLQAAAGVDWVSDAVFYEIDVRSITPEGTLRSAEDRLAEIRQIGITALILRPIHPIGDVNRMGQHGSPYAVQDFMAVHPEYGSLEDLRAFVATAQSLGMRVLMDMPASSAAWDSRIMFEHPEWFLMDASGAIVSPDPTRTDVAGLNYGHHELRKYMVSVMEYWVREAGIDGYRCDDAGLIPLDFWEIVRGRLANIRPALLLSDDFIPEHASEAFDVMPGWLAYDALGDVVAGREPAQTLHDALANEMLMLPEGARLLRTAGPMGNDLQARAGDLNPELERSVAALIYTLPGVPHIYNGAETGRIPVLSASERSSIDWTIGTGFRTFYQRLGILRAERASLRTGGYRPLTNSDPHRITSFERSAPGDRVITVVNWSGMSVQTAIGNDPSPTGWFDGVTGDHLEDRDSLNLVLPPYSFKILLSGQQP